MRAAVLVRITVMPVLFVFPLAASERRADEQERQQARDDSRELGFHYQGPSVCCCTASQTEQCRIDPL